MAAAFHQDMCFDSGAHRLAEIDAGNGTARARAGEPAHGNGESRPAEPLLQPRGHQADDAGMPALRSGHDHGRPFLVETKRGQGFRLGFGDGRHFENLTFLVETIEFGGDAHRLRFVIEGEKPRAERSIADASARIDARPDHEAEREGLGRPIESGGIEKRAQADAAAPTDHLQAGADECAIETAQRHHVGNGGERHEVEALQEIGRRAALAPKTLLAQAAIERDESHEHDAGGAEIAEAREIIEPVRIDDGNGRGQHFRRLVMIEHDHV